MTKKGKRTCIKGLPDFKNGCPEKHGVYPDGCPAWKEYTVSQDNHNGPVVIRDCVDVLKERWQFEALKLLEGNQRATESFRNGMCETAKDGQVYPKVDRAVLELVLFLQRAKEDQLLIDSTQSRRR